MAGKLATSIHTDITRMAPKPAKALLTLDESLLQTSGVGAIVWGSIGFKGLMYVVFCQLNYR